MQEALFIGTNGYVAAIRTSDGHELWRARLRAGLLETATYATISEDVCLLYDEGRVYAGCSGYLFCLDAATGEILWKNDLADMGFNDVTLAMKDKAVQFSSTHHRGGSNG